MSTFAHGKEERTPPDPLLSPLGDRRESAVYCPFHHPSAPVQTWNYNGVCDRHQELT